MQAQQQVRKETEKVHHLRIAALPKCLADLEKANPGSRCVHEADSAGRLKRFFILLKPVYEFCKLVARPSSGSDFGAATHAAVSNLHPCP